jgi:NtrC-family two-component system response regulator AlgB
MNFLVIDDDKTFRDATCFLIEDEGHSAEGAATGAQAIAMLKKEKFDAILLDLNLGEENGLELLPELLGVQPSAGVVIFTAQGSVQSAVEAMRRGAVDYLEKPFHREDLLTVITRLRRLRERSQQIEQLERDVQETRSLGGDLIYDFTTPNMREIMEVLLRAAPTPASVLLLGESGTGKTVAARFLHEHSHLAHKPFVTVSCPSLSKELLESELFGHVKGSFTGAIRDHWGKVRAAEGGTLFLDEIGDLPMEIQPKLLRLLQEREYERLGENVTRQADVRIITATNRDLKKRVAEGAFRQDLYFRLNVISVEIPPLRARTEDIIRFAQHYAQDFAARCGRAITGFDEDGLASLRHYSWPGNLREMRNAVERAVILCKGDKISSLDLPSEMRLESLAADNPEAAIGAPLSLEKLEELQIRKVLQKAPNFGEAAAMLGIDQTTLFRKRKRFGIQ